jgi:hypothetical protein
MAKDENVDLSSDLVVPRGTDGSVPQTITLRGYVGPSNTSGSTRIYTDLSFSTYYEVSSDAIVSRLKGDKAEDPSIVLIATDARVQRVTVTTATIEASSIGMLEQSQSCTAGPRLTGDQCASYVICPSAAPCVSLAICAEGQMKPRLTGDQCASYVICPSAAPCVSLAICP